MHDFKECIAFPRPAKWGRCNEVTEGGLFPFTAKRLWNGSMHRFASIEAVQRLLGASPVASRHAALKSLDPPELARIALGQGPSVLGGQGS
jgi:hypothetical protein